MIYFAFWRGFGFTMFTDWAAPIFLSLYLFLSVVFYLRGLVRVLLVLLFRQIVRLFFICWFWAVLSASFLAFLLTGLESNYFLRDSNFYSLMWAVHAGYWATVCAVIENMIKSWFSTLISLYWLSFSLFVVFTMIPLRVGDVWCFIRFAINLVIVFLAASVWCSDCSATCRLTTAWIWIRVELVVYVFGICAVLYQVLAHIFSEHSFGVI